MNARGSLAWAGTFWALAGLGAAAGATVRVQVVDDAFGQTVPARAYLWRGDEPLLPPGFSSYSRGDERHFLVPGDFALDLAPGKYRLRVERGLEYVPVELELEVPRSTPVPVRLRRWVDMNRDGWYSADMHVHRDPAEIPLILKAENLNFVPTITTHVWSNDVSQPWKSPSDFPVVVEPSRLFTANAQEVERIQGGPGAVILLARDLPLPFTGYELYPPAVTYTRKTHEMGGFVEGDKLFWVDTFVNAALGEIDFIELNCNHFLPRLVDTDLAPWSHWPIEFGYRGPRGFALWMMDLYYRILNSGIELPLSAGSANGVKATPVGYDRVYVRLGKDAFDYPAFMGALKRGRSFSTNGPILELEVDGRHGPGDRIEIRPAKEHTVRARARSRGELEVLQLVVNGEVVAEQKGQGVRELTLEKALLLDRSSWAAVRVFERGGSAEAWEPAGLVFAHTSPIYFSLAGRPVVVPESVRDLLHKIDVLIAHTERLDGFREEAHRQETLDVYRQAREVLERRLAGPAPAVGLRERVGVFLRCTGQEDPRRAFEAVKSLGLERVQVSRLPDRFYTPEGAREFAGLLKETGVRADAVVVVFEGESYKDREAVMRTVGLRPAALRPARMDYAKRCIDFAKAIGTTIVTFHMGFLPRDPKDPVYAEMRDAVSALAAYAASKGVTLSLETGQETGEELARFLDAITVTRVGVNFDTANLVLYGLDDPPRALEALLGRVTSLHVKDGLPPNDPRLLGREVPLGEGKAQVRECLRLLDAAGFRGPLIIENYSWRDRGTDPLEELARARDFILSHDPRNTGRLEP